MRNSIRQMLRTPFKLLLFFLFIGASTLLLTLGLRLWMETGEKLRQAEENFTTIGMVRQRENLMEAGPVWQAGTRSYLYYDYPIYEEILSESLLDFDGADYLKGPEKRPVYGSWMPDYDLEFEETVAMYGIFTAEISPVEDCVPSQPVQVNIKRVLYGDARGSTQCWFCDHNNPDPPPMEKGKTYIVTLAPRGSSHLDREEVVIECIPTGSCYPVTSQCSRNGAEIAGTFAEKENDPSGQSILWEEVTEGFYETGRGVYWLNAIEAQEKFNKTVQVLPTDSLALLPSFHEKESQVLEGREISTEEFEKGKAVCMVSKSFAQRNGLRVGDTIPLSLYYADYGDAPGYLEQMVDFGLLNARGEVYPAFWETKYEIVGFYQYTPSEEKDVNSVEIGGDMILIPANSVKASDENNIVKYGPMQMGTTSFQIPNGSAADFLENFKEVENSDFLEIRFDDNGYEQVLRELESAGNTAALLAVTGFLSAAALLLLLAFFFIVKQKRRTAIERSLGMTRSQCRKSLLGGILLFTFFAALTGSLIGKSLYSSVKGVLARETEQEYSMKYSTWQTREPSQEELEVLEQQDLELEVLVYLGVPGSILADMLGISWVLMERNLKVPPMEVMSMRE